MGTQFGFDYLLQYFLRFRILSDLKNIYSVSTLGTAIGLICYTQDSFGETKVKRTKRCWDSTTLRPGYMGAVAWNLYVRGPPALEYLGEDGSGSGQSSQAENPESTQGPAWPWCPFLCFVAPFGPLHPSSKMNACRYTHTHTHTLTLSHSTHTHTGSTDPVWRQWCLNRDFCTYILSLQTVS